MIKVTARTVEDGTRVKMEQLSGNIDEILNETASIVSVIIGDILSHGGPQEIRAKEYEAFIMQTLIKRIKEGVKQITDGEAEIVDSKGIKRKGIVTPKKKTIRDIIDERRNGIDEQPEDEKRFLN